MEDGTVTFPAGGLTIEVIKKAVHTTLGLAFANVIPVYDMISRIERASGKATAAE